MSAGARGSGSVPRVAAMPYTWTEAMRREALELKATLMGYMDARGFLGLTLGPPGSYPSSLEDLLTNPRVADLGADAFRRLEEEIPPFLELTLAGDVVGHEGRHRAAGVIRHGGDAALLPVAIRLATPEGRIFVGEPPQVPKFLRGEFTRREVCLAEAWKPMDAFEPAAGVNPTPRPQPEPLEIEP